MLAARHDDDDDDLFRCLKKLNTKSNSVPLKPANQLLLNFRILQHDEKLQTKFCSFDFSMFSKIKIQHG